MCPIGFGGDIMHINEWAGLKVKILKCSYFNNRLSVLFHIWYDYVGSSCVHVRRINILSLIDMHSGRGLMFYQLENDTLDSYHVGYTGSTWPADVPYCFW